MLLRPRLLLTGLILLATAGCSQQLLRQTCVALSQQVNYCLAPLPALSKSTWSEKGSSQSQKVSITINDKRHELLSEVELSPQTLSVVGLAPLGQPLFDVSFDGKTLTSEQSLLLGDNFRAEYLVALLQLIYWPEAQINGALTGGRLAEQTCGVQRCRLISSDEGGLVQIVYSEPDPWQAKVMLTIPAAKLTLKITPLT